MQISISERLFGKKFDNLTKEDLENFFKLEQIENSILEFKSYKGGAMPSLDDLLNKISVSLSAFLNSEGGVLIWGAPVGRKGKKEDVYTGPLTPIEIDLDKDTIVRKISSKIVPTSPTVKFSKVKIGKSQFCYIFEVNRSEFAPHQVDGRYMMRLDGSNIPAPHYYVEALFKRISYPNLTGLLSFGKVRAGVNFAAVPFTMVISNLSHFIPEMNLTYHIGTDRFKIYGAHDKIKTGDLDERKIVSGKSPILKYGFLEFRSYFLLLDRKMINSDNIVVKINMYFGGDSVPLMLSNYELRFKNDGDLIHSFEVVNIREGKRFIDVMGENIVEDFESTKNKGENNLKRYEANLNTFPIMQFINDKTAY